MSETNTDNKQQTNTQQTEPQTGSQPAFDYDKLAGLIAGKQTVAEDTVLKSYFKQQGLSADEMSQAISSYKAQKAKNTPNVAELQNAVNTEKSARIAAEVNQSATIEAIKQGVDVKSIPYVLKMADFKGVVGEDGKLDSEKLSKSIKTVLDDIPALKGSVQSDNDKNGIQQIGGDGQQNNKADNAAKGAVPAKKWNKFNI